MTEELLKDVGPEVFELESKIALLRPIVVELHKANKYLKSILWGVSFFVVLTILVFILGLCLGGSLLT